MSRTRDLISELAVQDDVSWLDMGTRLLAETHASLVADAAVVEEMLAADELFENRFASRIVFYAISVAFLDHSLAISPISINHVLARIAEMNDESAIANAWDLIEVWVLETEEGEFLDDERLVTALDASLARDDLGRPAALSFLVNWQEGTTAAFAERTLRTPAMRRQLEQISRKGQPDDRANAVALLALIHH